MPAVRPHAMPAVRPHVKLAALGTAMTAVVHTR